METMGKCRFQMLDGIVLRIFLIDKKNFIIVSLVATIVALRIVHGRVALTVLWTFLAKIGIWVIGIDSPALLDVLR
jgi:hypothetical protein